ncbi:TolC family protein [Candidatus Fermentibacterales bacterium]|nr:TolC family protein [Candidatus Fermentibacterales bacterium]
MSKAVAVAVLAITGLSWSVDLEQAVGMALSNRGDVEAAAHALHGSEWSERGARYWFLPSIYGSLTFLHDYDVQEIEVPGVGSFSMGPEWISDAGITVDVPLFVPQGPAGYRLASRSSGLAGVELDATRQNAILDVIRAFYGLLLAREMVAVSEEALAIAEEGYNLAAIRYEAGAISRFELLQSRVAWENRKPEAIAAQSQLESARAGLRTAMGLDIATPLDAEGCLEDCLPLDVPSTLEEAVTLMSRNSPELALAEGSRSIASASVDMQRASLLPSLFLQASYGFQAQRSDWHFSTDDYERDLNLMLVLQVPIFNGLNDISSYNAARYDRLAADAGSEAMEQASGLSLVQGWNGLEESRERVEATSHTLSQAEEAAGIATVSYEAGTITRLDMDQAFLALTSARTNYASALYSLRLSEAGLARSMGTLDQLDFVEVTHAPIE